MLPPEDHALLQQLLASNIAAARALADVAQGQRQLTQAIAQLVDQLDLGDIDTGDLSAPPPATYLDGTPL